MQFVFINIYLYFIIYTPSLSSLKSIEEDILCYCLWKSFECFLNKSLLTNLIDIIGKKQKSIYGLETSLNNKKTTTACLWLFKLNFSENSLKCTLKPGLFRFSNETN